MSAETARQGAVTDTWAEYLEALEAFRQHRTSWASERVQRSLQRALEQGRLLRERAASLRAPGDHSDAK